MNIVETLIKLRDDLKAWVTVNINALNSKIDNNIVHIDSELNGTSENPIQNKAVHKQFQSIKSMIGNKSVSKQIAETADIFNQDIQKINSLIGETSVQHQINKAIEEQEHFSGNYYDLENAPSILDTNPSIFAIADNDGNVVFKIDNDGVHSANLILNNEIVATENYVNELINDKGGIDLEYLNDSVKGIVQQVGTEIPGQGDEFIIIDRVGNIIFRIDNSGVYAPRLFVNGENVNSFEVVAPVKGVDYFTATDKNEFVTAVLNALPEWQGGVF